MNSSNENFINLYINTPSHFDCKKLDVCRSSVGSGDNEELIAAQYKLSQLIVIAILDCVVRTLVMYTCTLLLDLTLKIIIIIS